LLNLQDRIVHAAYPLFAERGLRDVTETQIQNAAGVTSAELAATFSSLNAVAAACLVEREREWTIAVVEAGARTRGATPEDRLLAVFDLLEEWFQSDTEDATTFLDALISLGREHRGGRANIGHLANVRSVITKLAREAELVDPERFALSFHVLMKGSILSALEGDTLTGVRARDMGRELIAAHRRSHTMARPTPRGGTAERAAVRPPAGSDKAGATWFGDLGFELEDTTTVTQRKPDPQSEVLDWLDGSVD
jgi:AcrR family transcriptional regulator